MTEPATHDINMERYKEQYQEPDPNAPKSSGYGANDDSYKRLRQLLSRDCEALSPEQLKEIQKSLAS